MKKCSICKLKFPDHLVHDHVVSMGGKSSYGSSCPLCALKHRNEMLGLPPDEPFGGPKARELHAEALQYFKTKGKS